MSRAAQTPLPPGSRPFDVVGFGVNAMDITAAVDGFPEPDTKAPMESFTIASTRPFSSSSSSSGRPL